VRSRVRVRVRVRIRVRDRVTDRVRVRVPLFSAITGHSPIAMSYGTYMGSIWELMWHTYGISCGLHPTTHMGATWANHMGSMWVPYGTHMWFTSVKPIWANHMYAT